MKVEQYNVDVHGEMQKHSCSSLINLNTCPRFGVVWGYAGKRNNLYDEPMPLRAGKAAHNFYSAVRLYNLYERLPEHFRLHARRLFGESTTCQMLEKLSEPNNDELDRITNYALIALYNSGYEDDPNDKKRSLQNIEDACVMYLRNWDFSRWEVFVEDVNNPFKRVGVEMAFDVVVDDKNLPRPVRLTGKLDGLMLDKTINQYVVHENKTTCKLSELWHKEKHLSWQLITYCLVMKSVLNSACLYSRSFAMSIPLPKKSLWVDGQSYEAVVHEDYELMALENDWIAWIENSVQTYTRWKHAPWKAPGYSHSCGRYFRMCALEHFCQCLDGTRKEMYDAMPEVDPFAYQLDGGEGDE